MKQSAASQSTKDAGDVNSFELEKWPFYMIVRTSAIYMKAMEAELKGGDLDIPSWRALMLLGDGQARSMSYLANEGVTKLSTMTRIVYRMRDQGLVGVRPRATDARVTEVYLTEKGNYARKVAWLHAQSIVKSAFGNVSSEEVDSALKTLSKVFDNLEAIAEPPPTRKG